MSLFMPCPTKNNAKDYVADLINLNYHKKNQPRLITPSQPNETTASLPSTFSLLPKNGFWNKV